MKSDIVDLEARLVHETDKAYLFDFGGDDNVWIPKSMCEWDDASQEVSMKESYAIEKGLV